MPLRRCDRCRYSFEAPPEAPCAQCGGSTRPPDAKDRNGAEMLPTQKLPIHKLDEEP